MCYNWSQYGNTNLEQSSYKRAEIKGNVAGERYEKLQYFAHRRNKALESQGEKQEKQTWLGKINKKDRKYQASRKMHTWKILGIQYGTRTLKILSANVGDLRNTQTLYETAIRMGKMKADVVCIQETHNANAWGKLLNWYRFISTSAITDTTKLNGKCIGGAEEMIKNEWINNIEQMDRYSHRSMGIITPTGINEKKLRILNNYATRMWYAKEESGKYWKEVKRSWAKYQKMTYSYGQRIIMAK